MINTEVNRDEIKRVYDSIPIADISLLNSEQKEEELLKIALSIIKDPDDAQDAIDIIIASSNDVAFLDLGDLIMIPTEEKLVIGLLESYEHPYVSVKDVPEKFPENLVYSVSEERLITLGLPAEIIEKVIAKENLPVIGQA